MKSDLIQILSHEPPYRLQQIYHDWFNPRLQNYDDFTALPATLRRQLVTLPFLTVQPHNLITDKQDQTQKILLKLHDQLNIETVLMSRKNKKMEQAADRRYTVCLSTQVGCPIKCAFCATGMLGFKRNLTFYEIIDQYRYWLYQLHNQNQSTIDNLVLMGQGEPFLNYTAVKQAVNLILKNTSIGPRQITISTVGIKEGMERLITDAEFPTVRIAISLHSALNHTRKKLIPIHSTDFFPWLVNWTKKYHHQFTSRAHFIGLEYLMIADYNDNNQHLSALLKLSAQLGKIRINLIPYNPTVSGWYGTEMEKIKKWQEALMQQGFTTTIRRSQGQNIAAACGQLANQKISPLTTVDQLSIS